ncbi:DivIVA domain-containing protein [Streptomyces sp. NPDC005438]|uniref:DivIVA domain-containing protein n=1 Tax=Streptomyces sp. NPDC005438 TaxID=3156880 RepID=UPI0033B86349
MFWFLLISLVVVVAAITLAVLSSTDSRGPGVAGGLTDAAVDQLDEPLPGHRPISRADVDTLRLPLAVRGYRMQQVDDVLDRLAAELDERDARIAELEAGLARYRKQRGTGPSPRWPEVTPAEAAPQPPLWPSPQDDPYGVQELEDGSHDRRTP